MMMSKITPHFTLAEFTKSEYAERKCLNNAIPKALMPNALQVGLLMEKVRSLLDDKMIIVNSMYRSPAVNKAVGGVITSEHCKALACDFVCPAFGTPYQIAKKISESNLEYGQLIYEGTWVHISVAGRHKKKTLTMKKGKYHIGILDI